MKRARITLTITSTYERHDDADLTIEEITQLRANLSTIAQQASLDGRYTNGLPEAVYLDNLDYHVELAKEVPMTQKTPLLPRGASIHKAPQVVHPMNAIGGLYIELLRRRDVPLEHCLSALKQLAREHGYNPNGKGTIGPPCQHGIDTVTHAVWFYDKSRDTP